MVVARGAQRPEFEKVANDEWLPSIIDDVQDRINDNKKYRDKETGEMMTKSVNEVRFKFLIDGYKFAHYSRWMSISTHEKATLFDKFIKKLVPDAQPNTAIDISRLKGMRIKTMWETIDYKGTAWQSVFAVKPVDMISAKDVTVD